MIEYSEEDIKKARIVKCRFSLLQLKWQCQSHYHLKNADKFDWAELSNEFQKMLVYYDNGGKLNEDILIRIYGVKLKGKLFINRIIKLIKDV